MEDSERSLITKKKVIRIKGEVWAISSEPWCMSFDYLLQMLILGGCNIIDLLNNKYYIYLNNNKWRSLPSQKCWSCCSPWYAAALKQKWHCSHIRNLLKKMYKYPRYITIHSPANYCSLWFTTINSLSILPR